MYNRYPDWQKQFPFWSIFTVKSIFRRLERLGVVESTQQHNRSRWDKTKWYTIDDAKLSELVPQPPAAEGPADDGPELPPSMAREGLADDAETVAIEDAEASPSWITKRSSKIDTKKDPQSGCAPEPRGEAHTHPLEDNKAETPVVTSCYHGKDAELDVAYAEIPEAEREAWYERADRALAAAGLSGWLRIAAAAQLPTSG